MGLLESNWYLATFYGFTPILILKGRFIAVAPSVGACLEVIGYFLKQKGLLGVNKMTLSL